MRDPEFAALASWLRFAVNQPEAALHLIDAEGITSDDFTIASIRGAWQLIVEQVRSGAPLDVLALMNKAKDGALLEMMAAMEEPSSISAFPQQRLRALHEAASRRRAMEITQRALQTLADETVPLPEGLEKVCREISALQANAGQDDAPATQSLLALSERLEEIASGRMEPVLRTGISALDELIGGLKRTLTIVAAMPGVGKSAFLATVCHSLVQRGVRVGFFSLEDDGTWLASRLVSRASRVSVFRLDNRVLSPEEQMRAGNAIERLYSEVGCLFVDDRPQLQSDVLLASARKMISKEKVQVLMVDHLGEVGFKEDAERRDLQIGDVLSSLRGLARVHKVPVVVASHLKQYGGLKPEDTPSLNDVNVNSAYISRQARVILGLSKNGSDGLKVTVLKQTGGPCGETRLRFDAPSAMLEVE